jgi:hypothetical protein
MPEHEDKLELELSQEGGRISASGSGASRLVHALADFVSPVTQGLGAIGDSVEVYRIHRRLSAIAALERAKELIEQEGKKPHPVSPKILTPWLEGASSEDLHGDNIIELWARILAASPEQFDSSIVAFIDVCRHIGPKEATLIPKLIQAEVYLEDGFSDSIEALSMDKVIGTFAQSMVLGHTKNEKIDFDRLQKSYDEWPIRIDGIIITQVFAHSGGAGTYRDTIDRDVALSLQILAREGFAEFSERSFTQGNNSAGIKYARGTRLTYEFFRQLYPYGLPETQNENQNHDRQSR